MASHDPDGTIVASVWTDNGALVATGLTPQLDLGEGTFNFVLTVTDDDGLQSSDTVMIIVTKGKDGGGGGGPGGGGGKPCNPRKEICD